MKLNEVHSVYFVGIGGIGMSALARYFMEHGIRVGGYDKTPSPLTESLKQEGADITFQDDTPNLSAEVDLCIYTPAIPKEHPVWAKLEGYNIPKKKRAEVLGLISNSQPTYAVAGTHGKTTTSAMLSHVFNEIAGAVNAFVGGIMTNYNSNYLFAKDATRTVVEADEYDRSFLHLNPKGSIITSTDADHLDIYNNPNALVESFADFADQTEETLLVHEHVNLEHSRSHAKRYGKGIECDYRLVKTENVQGAQRVFIQKGEDLHSFELVLPGEYNALNALAAFAMAVESGENPNEVAQALSNFKGVKRRFEMVAQNGTTTYIDDYAHHPTELNAVISAARDFYPNKHLAGIFQPHLYSRTRDFEDGFAQALSKLDTLYLMDIYPAREEPIPGVTSSALLEKITAPSKFLVQKDTLVNQVLKEEHDVLLTLGAGDIDRFVEPLKEALLA